MFLILALIFSCSPLLGKNPHIILNVNEKNISCRASACMCMNYSAAQSSSKDLLVSPWLWNSNNDTEGRASAGHFLQPKT